MIRETDYDETATTVDVDVEHCQHKISSRCIKPSVLTPNYHQRT